jgi:hypothetical protein
MRIKVRWVLPATLIAVVVAACSASSTPPPVASQGPAPSATSVSATPSPASAPTPAAVPSSSASLPPASASLSLTGGLTGLLAGLQVTCDEPSLGGLVISLFGQTATPNVYTTITLASGNLLVTLDAGSGTTFTARTFKGAGVTDFDAAKGAQIDSSLAEVASGSNPGTLPAVSAVKGSVDCGSQVPGSSTLTVAGNVPEGALSGLIDPIRVDCNPNAKPATVHAIGLVKVGTTPVVLVLQATAAGFSAFVVPTATTKQHFFTTSDPTAATISPTGGHVAGSATESGTTNTIQLSGDLVCGVVNP